MVDYCFDTTMGVGEFCSGCSFSAIFSMFAKMNQIDKERNDEFEVQRITGKLLHSLVQNTFIKDFDKIIFFIYRLGVDKKQAVKMILLENLRSLDKYLSFVELNANKASYETILGTQSANIISTTMRDHIDILSEISMEMIQKDNQGKYYCTLIDNELKVVKALNHNIFLKGKIDSLIINRVQGNKNEIKIVDVKTGRSKSNSHSKQVKLYSDLLYDELNKKFQANNKNIDDFQFFIRPELWYTNPQIRKPSKLKRDPIKQHIKKPQWEKTKGKMLESVKTKIKQASLVTIEEACNFRDKNWKEHFTLCKFCGNLCQFIEEFSLPSGNHQNGTLNKWLRF